MSSLVACLVSGFESPPLSRLVSLLMSILVSHKYPVHCPIWLSVQCLLGCPIRYPLHHPVQFLVLHSNMIVLIHGGYVSTQTQHLVKQSVFLIMNLIYFTMSFTRTALLKYLISLARKHPATYTFIKTKGIYQTNLSEQKNSD